jgi:hypothetical protein
LDSRRFPGRGSGGLLREMQLASRKRIKQERFELARRMARQTAGAVRWRQIVGEYIFMNSVRPDNTDPMPLRSVSPGVGTIIIRFVGLLLVSIVVLALIWSR